MSVAVRYEPHEVAGVPELWAGDVVVIGGGSAGCAAARDRRSGSPRELGVAGGVDERPGRHAPRSRLGVEDRGDQAALIDHRGSHPRVVQNGRAGLSGEPVPGELERRRRSPIVRRSGDEVLAALRTSQTIAVVRAPDPERAVAAAEELLGRGIGAIELTFTTPEVDRALPDLARRHPEAVFGLGTITTSFRPAPSPLPTWPRCTARSPA